VGKAENTVREDNSRFCNLVACQTVWGGLERGEAWMTVRIADDDGLGLGVRKEAMCYASLTTVGLCPACAVSENDVNQACGPHSPFYP